ncbi:hypothetical protein LCGC14_0634250 [marine sediment metagenome]|uniref:Uncharacterized protein n=1 Tax=marine sediment metagenome TaxID=412755 RepID=A0A0F9U9H3_9ZZZZ
MCQQGLEQRGKIELSDKERHLIERLRLYPHGVVEVLMVNGQPERTVKIRESEKL